MNNWNKSEIWKKHGNNFCIEIKRWIRMAYGDKGENNWGVYAYIYPNHPLFDKISKSENNYLYDDVISEMPLHGGCSYCTWHINSKGEVASKQVGADYQHYCDNYSHDETMPLKVELDAEELFNYMEQEANQKEVGK